MSTRRGQKEHAGPGDTSTRRRARLDEGAVIATGLRIVRDEGLPAVTMRRLADELETAPMSLYRHVSDREALLVGMLDHVARSIPHPPAQPTPRAEVAAVMQAIHDALGRDPWVVELLVTAGLAGPSILPLVERALGGLRGAGLEPLAAGDAFNALIEFTYGEVLVTHHDRADSYARRMARTADPARFPHLAAVGAARAAAPPPTGAEHGYRPVVEGMLDALLP